MTHFRLEVTTPADGGREVVPVLDGVPLTELVAAFEAARGWDPAGGYGGRWFDPARPGEVLAELRPGRRRLVAVLACECGTTGCWPLETVISPDDDAVHWSGFRQPHRPAWDYRGFGPFTFDAEAYRAALVEAFGSH